MQPQQRQLLKDLFAIFKELFFVNLLKLIRTYLAIPLFTLLESFRCLIKSIFVLLFIIFIIYIFASKNSHFIFDAIMTIDIGAYDIFNNMDDDFIRNCLQTIMKFIVACLPISLTFLFFFYREQRTTSESALIRIKSNRLVFAFIFNLIALFGLTSFYLIQHAVLKESFATKTFHADELVMVLLSVIAVLFLGINLVHKLFGYININWSLSYSIEEANKLIRSLTYISSIKLVSGVRKSVYNDLNLIVESVYQMLVYSVEKNLIETYNSNSPKWYYVIRKLQYNNRMVGLGKQVNLFVYFFQIDPGCYYSLYRTIITNHFLLIVSLYNKQRMREGNICLEQLLSMNSQIEKSQRQTHLDDRLSVEFFSVLYELTIYYRDKHIDFQPLFEKMNLMLKQKIEYIYVLILYKSLLIKAVFENDVNFLTELTYALHKSTYVSLIGLNSKQLKSIENIDKYIRLIGERQFDAIIQKANNDRVAEGDKNLGMCIYVLLQASIKTIELSRYELTGYLVKYLVSNFESDDINNENKVLLKNNLIDDLKVDNNKLAKCIRASFKLNEKTAKYCMQKLTILIYAQQKFIKENHVAIGLIPKAFIDTSSVSCDYLDYLINKISDVNRYGLLFLNKEGFMSEVKNEILLSAARRAGQSNSEGCDDWGKTCQK
jgi:hypothetical protein